MIIAAPTPAALAATAATSTIPIVFEIGADRSQLGLSRASIDRAAMEIVPKRLELLRESLSTATNTALLVGLIEEY